jgi:Tetratricopeptide repeat
MRSFTKESRPGKSASALICAMITWLGLCGCQGPQFDRLDGSPSIAASTQAPVVDNAQPSHSAAQDSAATAGEALAQSSSKQAMINEKLNSGHRAAALERLEEAEVCYRSVLELEPDNAIANHRLAILSDRRGNFAISEKHYLAALKREPNNPDLLSDLGYSYFLQSRYAESERSLQAAVRANPSHRKAADNLAHLYAKLGDRDRAFETLKRSVGDTDARVRLAQFFPNPQPVPTDDETITASFAPLSPHDVAASSEPKMDATSPSSNTADQQVERLTPGTAVDPVAFGAQPTPEAVSQGSQPPPAQPSQAERQLAELMDRERQRAADQRSDQTSGSIQAVASPGPVPTGEPVAVTRSPAVVNEQPASAAAQTAGNPAFGNTATSPAGVNGRIPDERINDAFAEIDREGAGPPPSSVPATHGANLDRGAPMPPAAATTSAANSVTASSQPWRDSVPTPPNSFAAQPASTSPASTTPFPQELDTKPSDTWPTTATPPRFNDVSAPPTASESGATALEESIPAPVPSPPLNNGEKNAPRPEDVTSIAIIPAARSEFGPTKPQPMDSIRQAFLEEADSTPKLRDQKSAKQSDAPASGAASDISAEFDSPKPSPRIVPTGVQTPARDDARPRSPGAWSEVDEFQTQTSGPGPQIIPGRSSSNAGSAVKPAVQSASVRPAASDDSLRPSHDLWPVQIEPRRSPPPLFEPECLQPTSKKPTSDKQDSFDAGTDWSDVPRWPGATDSAIPGKTPASGAAAQPGSN